MASKKIGLDAGHGLNTPGKRTPDGIREWTLNDKVRDKVVSYLKDYDVTIVHTDNNEGNTDESLSSRINCYLNAGVDAFVSIHHNAYTGSWNNATGVEVYTDMNPTAKDNELAQCIYNRLVKNTGLRGRGIKKEAFYVINQNRIPAVLVEGGFMDGTSDYKLITSDKGQDAYARAVADGLIEFLKLQKKTNTGSKPSIPSNSSDVKKGSVVSIKKGATYYNGSNVPDWVENKQWIVSSVSGDRVVIDKSVDGQNSINSPINVKFLTVVKSGGSSSSNSFMVKVEVSNLNIRKGPGTNYEKTGSYTGVGSFTIVDTNSGLGSKTGWGLLKSYEKNRNGWISLDFAKRI